MPRSHADLKPFDASLATFPTQWVETSAVIDPLPAPHARKKVEEFRKAMLEGASFPPISGVRLGRRFIIADGHKRFAAYRTLQQPGLRVEVWPLRRWLSDQSRQGRKTLRRASKAARELREQGLQSHEARDLAIGTARHYRRILASLGLVALFGWQRFRDCVRDFVIDVMDLLASLALRILASLLSLLPRPLVASLGSVVGRVGYHLLRRQRSSSLQNLAATLGQELSVAQRNRIARSSFANLLRVGALLLHSSRYSPSDFLTWIEARQPQNMLPAASHGRILASLHIGDWELGHLAAGAAGVPLLIEACNGDGEVALLGKRRRTTGFLWKLRGISGNRRAASMEAVVDHLKEGGDCGLLVDLNGSHRGPGAWIEFLGLPCYAQTSVGEIVARTNKPLFLVWCRPLAGGRGTFEWVQIDYPPAASPAEITGLCLKTAERFVRENPELWLWCYRKWRRRPTPELGRYPPYSRYRNMSTVTLPPGPAPRAGQPGPEDEEPGEVPGVKSSSDSEV